MSPLKMSVNTIAVTTLLLSAGTASAVNLVANPSFELGNFDDVDVGGFFQVTQVGGPQPSNKITSWAVSNSLIWIDNAYGGPLSTPAGARFLDMTAFTNNVAQYASVSQVLATAANTQYTLTFDLGSSQFFGILPVIALTTAGITVNFAVTAVPTTNSQWTSFSYTFTSTGIATPITFTGIQGSDYIGLDNISVEISPIPEPSALFTLVAGLAAVGAVVTRRRKQVD